MVHATYAREGDRRLLVLSYGTEQLCRGKLIMKAISLHQPWASMIASGKKTIETRRWPTRYRGDLLIVSSKQPIVPGLPSGKALCIVELYGCERFRIYHEPQACCQWFPTGYAWLLRNIRPIEPFAVRGSQGFYEVDLPANPQCSTVGGDDLLYLNSEKRFVNSQS